MRGGGAQDDDRGQPDGDPSRLDRELIERLNELRVALPGVQVLFAFLLTVPFTQRFEDITRPQRDVYFSVLLLAAVATAFLMTPTAFHRLRFRRRDKGALLRVGNRMAIAGLACLSLAVSGAVFLIADLLFGRGASVTVAVAVLLVFAGLWYVLPFARKVQRDELDIGARKAAEGC